jgi:hypothetical protein
MPVHVESDGSPGMPQSSRYHCNAKIRLTNDNIFDMLVLYYTIKHDFI